MSTIFSDFQPAQRREDRFGGLPLGGGCGGVLAFPAHDRGFSPISILRPMGIITGKEQGPRGSAAAEDKEKKVNGLAEGIEIFRGGWGLTADWGERVERKTAHRTFILVLAASPDIREPKV